MNCFEKHIFLVGFMASGKSSVGRRLARVLGRPFIDLDAYIEESTGREIRDIFEAEGESIFRSIERECLEKVANLEEAHVVALGGGTPCTQENAAIIDNSGFSIYLKVDDSILVERLMGDTVRPLVRGKSKSELIALVQEKMEQRSQWYQSASITVDGAGSKESVVNEIQEIMNDHKTSVDILAIGVHPDDIELCASGTLLRHIDQRKSVAICDLTAGELGTRGSGPLRIQEAEDSKNILGVVERVNLGMADGFFQNNKDNVVKLVEVIRRFRPQVVLANAPSDRHPDHGRAAKLISDACFYAGLRKIETETKHVWRPKAVYHYIQDRFMVPDVVVDITDFMDKKFESILAYKSQFFDPNSDEPSTPISGQDFLEYIKAQDRIYGRYIGVKYAEGFKIERPIGVDDLTTLL